MNQRYLILWALVLLGLFGAANVLSAQADSEDASSGFWSKTQVRVGYGNFPVSAYESNGGRLWPSLHRNYYDEELTYYNSYVKSMILYLPYKAYRFGDVWTYGSVHAGFVYEMSSRWNVALNLMHSSAWASLYRNSDNSLAGKSSYQFYEAAVTFQYQWILRDMLQVYSGIGAHVTWVDFKVMDKLNYAREYISLQFVPIGISYGKEWFGFAEWGIGHLSVLQVGVGHRF